MKAMLIRTTAPHQIVIELDQPEVELTIERKPDGDVIAAWIDTDSREVIQFVEVGVC